ncbi:136_t:CDS:2 [Gigaspora margarita]|uniref:136_t:CDS:1 n=1 Tax=Gigaspora margarita TaxID=4874 RepID=A0ABN7W3U0_GIGMA|nr:136_t:CDS:2 [Gigaspora margarita]
MSTNDNTTPTLNCFVHKETINDIFPVVVDNTMDVEKLRNEIKRVRPNLSQINFDLYEAHDFTPNYRIVNNVNSKDIPDEESVFMDPIEKISKYFPHLKLGIPKPSPQPLDDEFKRAWRYRTYLQCFFIRNDRITGKFFG